MVIKSLLVKFMVKLVDWMKSVRTGGLDGLLLDIVSRDNPTVVLTDPPTKGEKGRFIIS